MLFTKSFSVFICRRSFLYPDILQKVDPKKILSRFFHCTSYFSCFVFADFILDSIQWGHPVKIDMQFFTPRWTLWYLMAMIIYQLLLPVFDTKNKRHRVAYLLLSMILGIVIGYNPDTENFMAMSRIMNFFTVFPGGYYEKTVDFSFDMGNREIRKRQKLQQRFLQLELLWGFILVSRLSTRKLFWGTESFDGGVYTWYTRILAWIIAFLWIWVLIVWVPTRRIPVIEVIGKNTLSVYLLHTIVILILMYTPFNDWIFNKIGWQLLISVGLTLGLSWNGFERLLRKIAIPYYGNQKK